MIFSFKIYTLISWFSNRTSSWWMVKLAPLDITHLSQSPRNFIILTVLISHEAGGAHIDITHWGLKKDGWYQTGDSFRCVFLNENYYFGTTFAEVFSWGSSWQWFSIGSCNGLVSSRWQAITWTNDEGVGWYINASPGLSEMIDKDGSTRHHLPRNIPDRLWIRNCRLSVIHWYSRIPLWLSYSHILLYNMVPL